MEKLKIDRAIKLRSVVRGAFARAILLLFTVVGLFGAGIYAWRQTVGTARLVRAWQLAADEQWPRVVRELERYVRWHPQDNEAIALLARAYDQLGDHLASARWWDRIAPESPQKRSALLAQGVVLLAANHASKAEQAWLHCLAKAEQDGDNTIFNQAIRQLVTLYWLEGRKPEIQSLATQWLDRSYRQADLPEHVKALEWQLKLRLLDMEPIEAIERLQRFVEKDENDCDARRGLGQYLGSLGRCDEAQVHLRRCLAQHPHDLRNWYEFVVLSIVCGDLVTAGEILQRLPAQARDTVPFLTVHGRWAQASGNDKAAEDSFRRILARDTRDEKALAHLVNILRQTGQTEELHETLRLLEETVRNRLRLQEYYTQLRQSPESDSNESASIAQLCESLGYAREALGWHRRAVSLNPLASASAAAIQLLGNLPPPDVGLEAIPWNDAIALNRLWSANDLPAGEAVKPHFSNVAERAGVNFRYFRGETGQYWIVEPNGGGAAWLDVDQDGWLDLFFLNGCPLRPGSRSAQTAADLSWSSRLFRNNGDETFQHCTQQAGLTTNVYGQGCSVADFDNDGFPDLYLTCYGANVLYHNAGDGTFRDVTTQSGTWVEAFSTGSVFADLNRDGLLDLYVVRYVDFDPALHGKPCRSPSGDPEYCGPRCCPGTPDVLYMGLGDGTFEDVSTETGVALLVMPGFAVVSADLNQDGWPDLYVANDGEPNVLWLNESAGDSDGRIRLRSCGVEKGCALNADGLAQGSMGIACGDVDRDGLLDLGVSNFYHEHYTIYRNMGGTGFEDLSVPYQLAGPTRTSMGWGTQFFDFDNDGWLDLFIANGHINRQRDGSTPYEMAPQLFRNSKHGKFIEVGRAAGPYFQSRTVGRGAAFGDYDNDGLEDIVVVHHHAPAALLHNETATDRTALVLKLVGRSSNRDAVNARVIATVRDSSSGAPLELVREITPGTSYLSANDCRVRFGLDKTTEVDICVRWPSGHVQVWHNLRPGGTKVLREMDTHVTILP